MLRVKKNALYIPGIYLLLLNLRYSLTHCISLVATVPTVFDTIAHFVRIDTVCSSLTLELNWVAVYTYTNCYSFKYLTFLDLLFPWNFHIFSV